LLAGEDALAVCLDHTFGADGLAAGSVMEKGECGIQILVNKLKTVQDGENRLIFHLKSEGLQNGFALA